MSIAEQPQAAEATERQTVRVMLDLETLGTTPGSVILSIGAVRFGGGEIIGRSFYERVDPQSCVDAGMTIDVATVQWWLCQSDEARRELTLPGLPLTNVLRRFADWLADEDAEVWGNGAASDNVWLADAYRRTGIPTPWSFRNDRCYRTIKSLHPDVPMVQVGDHHNALDDAVSQANHLMRILPNL